MRRERVACPRCGDPVECGPLGVFFPPLCAGCKADPKRGRADSADAALARLFPGGTVKRDSGCAVALVILVGLAATLITVLSGS